MSVSAVRWLGNTNTTVGAGWLACKAAASSRWHFPPQTPHTPSARAASCRLPIWRCQVATALTAHTVASASYQPGTVPAPGHSTYDTTTSTTNAHTDLTAAPAAPIAVPLSGWLLGHDSARPRHQHGRWVRGLGVFR